MVNVVTEADWIIEAIMRTMLILVSVYNMWFSFKPTMKFARGENPAPNIFYASIFFSDLAYLIFGLLFFFGFTSYSWTLLLLVLRMIAATLIAIAYRNAIDQKIAQFYSLYDALPQALAIADLSRIDPAAADRMMEEANRMTALKLAGSAVRAG